MRKAMVCALLLLLGGGAWAAAGFDGFEKVVRERSANYNQAQSQLELAQARWEALQSDDLAAPAELAEAERTVRKARISLVQAELAARKEAYRLWTDVLLARVRVGLAQKQEEVARVQLEAARLRKEKGLIAAAELESAERGLEEARLQLQEEQAALGAALGAVRRYADLDPQELPRLSEPEAYGLEAHPDFRSAEIEVEDAQAALDAALGPDTARSERERRQAVLRAAKQRLADVRVRLERRLDELRASSERQARLLELKRAALADVERKLAAQRLRLQKGLVAPLDVTRAEAALERARLDELSAAVRLGQTRLELWAYAEAR